MNRIKNLWGITYKKNPTVFSLATLLTCVIDLNILCTRQMYITKKFIKRIQNTDTLNAHVSHELWGWTQVLLTEDTFALEVLASRTWFKLKFKPITWPEWTREFNLRALYEQDCIVFRLNKLIWFFSFRYISLSINFWKACTSFLNIFNVHFKIRILEINMISLSSLTSLNIIRKKA